MSTSLLTLLTEYWKVLKITTSIQVKKVAAHTGVEGNERADRNADMGARHLLTYEGRHALVPPAALRPPPNPNSTAWVSQYSPSQQNAMLTKAQDHASSATLTPRPPSLRKKHITARTWEKIQELQTVSVDTPLASVRIATLRRQVKQFSLQDKKDFISDNLLEDYRGTPADKYNQVKKLRSVFQPRPTKVRHPNGHIATVEQRATTLANFWAQNVWKAPPPSLPHWT